MLREKSQEINFFKSGTDSHATGKADATLTHALDLYLHEITQCAAVTLLFNWTSNIMQMKMGSLLRLVLLFLMSSQTAISYHYLEVLYL